MIMTKIVLISFADKRFRNALKRLEGYTKEFPFTERHFHTQDNTFTKAYWRRLRPWLYRRGYGYWEWKSRLIKQSLKTINDGDFLIWSDVGVFWNSSTKALKRFSEYLSMMTNGINVLTFQEPYIEQEWTKGDLLMALGVYNDKEICNSYQLWSGVFLLKKSKDICDMIDKWDEINKIDKELVTDKSSTVPNKDGFKEHRHDQSSFSILVKRMPHIEISYKETHPEEGNWDSLVDYPILGRRHKLEGRPLFEIIRNKLLRPWRMILFVYFRHYRHYYFRGNSYPW